MNALRNIHAALVPGGLLVDIHPIPPAEQAEAAGQILGRLDERDVLERFDTVEEFFEIVGEREGTRIPARLASRVRAASPPIDLRERVVFRRFHAF